MFGVATTTNQTPPNEWALLIVLDHGKIQTEIQKIEIVTNWLPQTVVTDPFLSRSTCKVPSSLHHSNSINNIGGDMASHV